VFNIPAVECTGNIPKNFRNRQLLPSSSLVDKFDFLTLAMIFILKITRERKVQNVGQNTTKG
jgi:hypothetical protein